MVQYFLQVPTATYIYMTFDDGPDEGTPHALDALKEVLHHFFMHYKCVNHAYYYR